MSLLPLLPQAGTAQTARRSITLDEAILLARVQSVDAAVALNELKTAYWEYRTFQANLLPEISFTATLPSYNKKYNSYQQDNGAYTYVRNDYMNLSGSISIDQSIWLTGGTLSLTTSLDYLTSDTRCSTTFMPTSLPWSAAVRHRRRGQGARRHGGITAATTQKGASLTGDAFRISGVAGN